MIKVVAIGRLTRDPEVKVVPSGAKIVEFSIAVDRAGGSKDEAGFFRCKCFGKSAEFVEAYISKGRLVAIDGRLEQRKYTDKDGQNRESIEIVGDNVQGLDRKPEDAGGD